MSNKPVSGSSTTSSNAKSAPVPDAGAKVQGEGDYEAARRHDKDVEHFVETADIQQAAHNAAPKNAEEAAEMQAAEQAGLARAKLPKEKK